MSPSHRKITPKKPKRSRLPTEPDTPHAPASARSDVPNLSASTKRQSVHLPKSEAETLRFYVLAHWTLVTAELPSSLFRTSFPGVSQGWIPGTLSTEWAPPWGDQMPQDKWPTSRWSQADGRAARRAATLLGRPPSPAAGSPVPPGRELTFVRATCVGREKHRD